MEEIPTEKTEEQIKKDAEITALCWQMTCHLTAVQKCVEIGRNEVATQHFRQLMMDVAQLAPLVDSDAHVTVAQFDRPPEKED